MKATYSAKALLSLDLAMLPSTERSIVRLADRDDWPFHWQTVRGGQRKMFLSELLPDEVRQAILDKKEIDSLVPAGRRPSPQDGLPVNRDQQKKSQLKADLLRLYLQTLNQAAWGHKEQARQDFITAYNTGLAYPDIFTALGELSWKTIEGWKAKLKKTGGDTLQLADRRGYHKKGKRGLTPLQTDILLRCALHPNKPRISEAIRMCHAVMNAKGIENGLSESTYRRWLSDWTERNHHIWTFNREGAKAWNDKCAFYIERDYSLINVGDIIVADGHVLNFEVINPWTGKPKRMALILFLDMKSGIPLGWEIMPTEDTAAISSALRRAILRLGKYPKVVYLDNGRAFKSRFFQGTNFEESGFAGLYERLGMKTIFAWPYHGQSKTIERFFGTFAELERWCPTYSGTSIEHKPPRMMRGERLHRKVYEKATGGHCLTMEQAHRAIAAWFDEYAQRPQRGHLEGQAPNDLFLEGRGPGIDKAELSYLMMSLEIKHIRRNGISFGGSNYYNAALYGRRHPVVIRYDLQDTSCLYVFETDGSFICEASQVDKIHPAATALGSDEDKEKLRAHIEFKKHLEKEASYNARTFLDEEVMPQHKRQMAGLGILQLEGPQPGEPQATITKLPVVHKLSLAEEERIMAEAADLDVVDEAGEILLGLENLSESDRYEKLVEMEAREMVVPGKWQAFMKYFEMTPEYSKDQEYFEELRVRMALVYQVSEAEEA